MIRFPKIVWIDFVKSHQFFDDLLVFIELKNLVFGAFCYCAWASHLIFFRLRFRWWGNGEGRRRPSPVHPVKHLAKIVKLVAHTFVVVQNLPRIVATFSRSVTWVDSWLKANKQIQQPNLSSGPSPGPKAHSGLPSAREPLGQIAVLRPQPHRWPIAFLQEMAENKWLLHIVC